MIKTRELLRAKLKQRLPEGEAIPPLTAIETVLCEIIDEMRHASKSRLVDIPMTNFSHLAVGESASKEDAA